ncbi:hypothetical protein [Parablautia sp. Marseille-Q6255]|uniref:hypothetical protein n=1 Tax=Parablautia sp. Marseille-Q6255 TaxID=3039593 RepID=UPI0024BD3738|nr:hypothetical protein [Parablautia sp. Marseille-Q6255]
MIRKGGLLRKRDSLLRMIAVCGEMPVQLVGKVVESDSYAASLLTGLKKDGYISVRNKDGYRGYVLREKGRRHMLEYCREDTAYFLQESLQTAHVKSELKKRVRLHRMSEVWIFFWKMGVRIFRSQKPVWGKGIEKNGVETAAYYGSTEYKNGCDAINGSRACGVLLSGKSAYVVYNTMEQRMKWAKKLERSMRIWTERELLKIGMFQRADAVILGRNMDFLEELLESDGGIRGELFQVDDIYERYYYIPMCEDARLQVCLLTDTGKQKKWHQFLGNMIVQKKEREYDLSEGYDAHGNPVYFCYELDMQQLLRIKKEMLWNRTGTIVCFDYQAEALKQYLGETVTIQAVITQKAVLFLQESME